jgi:hypothetical protein
MPREEESNDESFWIGPLSNQQDTETSARGLAKGLGFEVHYCKVCFRDRRK